MSEHPDRPPLDKTAWGPGPWQDEPDRVEWAHAGVPCLAIRNRLGVWCGYAAVPPGHPLHRVPYDETDLDAHGGLTYSSLCEGSICHVPAPGDPDDVWWFGFDCAHGFDLAPAMAAEYRKHPSAAILLGDTTYRTLAYVTAEVNALAEQLRALASKRHL